jgi:tetratricopeptide (TPR) repeat protein
MNILKHDSKKIWLFTSLVTTLTLFLLSSCSPSVKHPQPKHPKSQPAASPPPLQSASSVERQLLTTVKQAETLGTGNPLLLSSLYSLATFYQDRQDFHKAALQYQRVLEIKEQQTGPDHPDVAEVLQRYAKVLHQANRHAEAESLSARAQSILANPSPPQTH